MASPSPVLLRRLHRTAAAAIAATGAVALAAGAASAAPAASSLASADRAASALASPCSAKQSEWATASTTTPVPVADLGGSYSISAKGSIGGYTTRAIESVTVYLDGQYVGRANVSKAQKPSYTVAALPRTWSIDVPAAAGTHELLVCSNTAYSSLAGVSTVVQVPAAVAAPGPTD